jgi:Zn-dependent alcohol dehydrogenase
MTTPTIESITSTVKSALNMAPTVDLPKTLTVEEVELKLPEKGEVLIKVEACGVCHSDSFAQLNFMGGGL